MPYGWDPAKRAANIAKHGVDFAAIEAFDWSTAIVRADVRFDYGEVRLEATGLIGARVYVLVFTIRRDTTWIISFRKGNTRETTRYEAET